MTLLGFHPLGNLEADTAKQAKRIAYDASNNPIYIGTAKPGTLSTSKGWTITKIGYDASNNPITFTYPNGSADPEYIWSNYITYTYS